MIAAKNSVVDQYIHYDSNISTTLSLGLPKDGIYNIEIISLALYFPGNYTPDPKIGFFVISGTQDSQLGNTTINGIFKNKQGGLVFPIYNLTSDEPQCNVVNSAFLHAKETLSVDYYQGQDFTKQTISRIVILIHISN